ncbi:hypothetical protein IFM89_000378 [Coptis chinensis]|uniref:Phytocyanin domain-containing protein n=1 Tax=Coptis chinensis TaxID=261450 RepID=A0A835H868_9MAGN|nr:hypothetical protein IFM89_000378 [Coptis chinensis]
MAFKQMFTIILVIAAATLPTITLAKEFIVGDEKGWTIGFDYQSWATGKEFRVGDTLGTGGLTSGSDVIMLGTPGRKWYICGVGKHCEVGGQKLAITVLSNDQWGAPAPAPSKSAKLISISLLQVLMAAVITMGNCCLLN